MKRRIKNCTKTSMTSSMRAIRTKHCALRRSPCAEGGTRLEEQKCGNMGVCAFLLRCQQKAQAITEASAQTAAGMGADSCPAGGHLQYRRRDTAWLSRFSWDAGARIRRRSCRRSRRFRTAEEKMAGGAWLWTN